MKIIWKDPPPAPQRDPRGKHNDSMRVVAELRKHPGKWALVETGLQPKPATSTRMRWRRYGCEAEIRTDPNEPTTRVVYARWPE
jgi:hypothetical protein